MMFAEERERLQRKLLLLTGAELREVDSFVETLLARRRRIAENFAGRVDSSTIKNEGA